MFGAYMAKYCDRWQHQLSRLSPLRASAHELYNKVQAESRVPQLEKNLEEARLKWADFAKETIIWISKVKKVRNMEADVTGLEKSISQLRSVHQTEIERKDVFSESEKAQVLTKLQASYNAKLLGMYVQQYAYGYLNGYVEVERLIGGDREPPTRDITKPAHNADSAELSRVREGQDRQEPVWEGMYELVMRGVTNAELDVIIVHETLVEAVGPSMPPLENVT